MKREASDHCGPVVHSRSLTDEIVSIVESHTIPYFGSFTLAEIKPRQVKAYRQSVQHLATQTINHHHTALKHMLGMDMQDEYVNRNVARLVKMVTPDNERDRLLTHDEWTRLYNAALPHLQDILLCAYHTGMRRGEVLGLKWENIDLINNMIYLKATATKTKQPRMIPITDDLR